MTKYVVIYHAPAMPEDAMDEEAMKAEMEKWNAWAEKCGEGLVDMGAPLGAGLQVSKDGTTPSEKQVAGYSILQAENMDEAVKLLENHPHLDMPEGCCIEIHEAQKLPGM